MYHTLYFQCNDLKCWRSDVTDVPASELAVKLLYNRYYVYVGFGYLIVDMS